MAGEAAELDTSVLVRQIARLMIEEALEAEVSERLGHGYYERGHVAEHSGAPAGIATACVWDG